LSGHSRSIPITHADHLVIGEDRMAEAARTSVRTDRVRQVLEDADGYTRQRALAAINEAFRAGVQGGEVRASRAVLVTGSA
jgi:hypothetical protein